MNDRPLLAKTVAVELQSLLHDNAPTEEYILEFLNGNEGRKEIEDALYELQRLGVHGIPKFIIEGSYIVDGAARSDVFVSIFREIERRGELQNDKTIFGSILGIADEVIDRGSHHAEDVRMKA